MAPLTPEERIKATQFKPLGDQSLAKNAIGVKLPVPLDEYLRGLEKAGKGKYGKYVRKWIIEGMVRDAMMPEGYTPEDFADYLNTQANKAN